MIPCFTWKWFKEVQCLQVFFSSCQNLFLKSGFGCLFSPILVVLCVVWKRKEKKGKWKAADKEEASDLVGKKDNLQYGLVMSLKNSENQSERPDRIREIHNPTADHIQQILFSVCMFGILI